MSVLSSSTTVNMNQQLNFLLERIAAPQFTKEELSIFSKLSLHLKEIAFSNTCYIENLSLAKQLILKTPNHQSIVGNIINQIMVYHPQKDDKMIPWLLTLGGDISKVEIVEVFKSQPQSIWNHFFSYYPLPPKKVNYLIGYFGANQYENVTTWILDNQKKGYLHSDMTSYYFMLYSNQNNIELCHKIIKQISELKPQYLEYIHSSLNEPLYKDLDLNQAIKNTDEFVKVMKELFIFHFKEKLEKELNSSGDYESYKPTKFKI